MFNYIMTNMSDYRNFANFNTFTVAGIISNVTEQTGRNGDFVVVTMITNLVNDGEGATIEFLDNGSIRGLYSKGYLPTGRRVQVTGHIKAIAETYTNQQGEVVMLKRPKFTLTDVTIPMGGLGPMPADKADNSINRVRTVVRPSQAAAQSAPAVDSTPVF